jgi:transcriptional regulator with XRE-family HTH domain
MTAEPVDRATSSPNIQQSLGPIGEQIRALRKELGFTLEELSRRTGVSVGLISQVERGKGNPSFGSLLQLAHGLDVPIGRLFQLPEQQSPVVRESERRALEVSEDGARYELLTPNLAGTLEVVWGEAPADYNTSATPSQHSGEEFGLVLSGSKDVFLDGVRYHLKAGDSITYSSMIPHWYAGDEPCTSIWVITPPNW